MSKAEVASPSRKSNNSKYNLPAKVTLREWQLNRLHESFMEAATYWAKSKTGSTFGDAQHHEALAYKRALRVVLAHTVPDESLDALLEEYRAMLFGPRKEDADENQ